MLLLVPQLLLLLELLLLLLDLLLLKLLDLNLLLLLVLLLLLLESELKALLSRDHRELIGAHLSRSNELRERLEVDLGASLDGYGAWCTRNLSGLTCGGHVLLLRGRESRKGSEVAPRRVELGGLRHGSDRS